MQVPVDVTFRGLDPDPRLRALIDDRIAHLERAHPGIISCHLTAGPAQARQRSATTQQVTLEVRVPGAQLVVRRHHADAPGQAYLAPVLRDAFTAMGRVLSRHEERRRGALKAPAGPLQGRIATLHPERDFGEILGNDHRLVYFHRNAVLPPGFEALTPDAPVSYSVVEGEGRDGPQASSVRATTSLRHDPGRAQ